MSSPKDSKRNLLGKSEDPPLKNEPAEDVKAANSSAATSNAQPLAPPPRPAQGAGSDAPDYFNQLHQPTQFSLEPNPFEQSFGNPSSETPGKSILPPVASITSPSPLQGVTPGWSSLRAGPLSPAMLAGPQTSTDYFSESFRGGFPTPNESSLRTGLTPGGGGSMFPAPSPNSQALFNLQSGGATPSTLDFHRTALSAAQANTKFNLSVSGPTSQPESTATASASQFPTQNAPAQPAQAQRGQQELIGSNHDVNTAANDLLQFSSGARNGIFAVPPQPPAVNTGMPMQAQGQESSPTARRGTKGSIGTSISAGSVDPGDQSDSGHSEQAKPASRSRSKKATNNKTPANRRKAEDTPVKTPANKKHKPNVDPVSPEEDEDSDMETSPKGDYDANGKKMTDEEKRKNFLERNRVAALKCRQRKKQWLANLQAKVELYSTENDALSAQVTALREEVVSLKTLLMSHKDCPVSQAQAQGLQNMSMNAFVGDMNHHSNPYNLAGMPNGIMQSLGPAGQTQRT